MQRHHAVAEHVPPERLRLKRLGCRIPDSRPKVCLGRNISRTRDNEDLTVAQQGGVDGIDWELVRQCSPLTLRSSLRQNWVRCGGAEANGKKESGED